MEIPPLLGLLSIAVLVLANGFFVATEFAFVAVRRSRLDQLAAEGSKLAVAARDVVGHLDAYIAACQLGITMASLALGWIGEPALAHLIERPLSAVLGGAATPAALHGTTVGISFALITALHIVIGELAPKGLALQKPEGTALWVAYPLRLFYRVFRWPIGMLNAVGNAVLAVLGLRSATGHEMVHTAEELRMLVHASGEAGMVEASEAKIASRAFRFADLSAGELMTPRIEVKAIALGLDVREILRLAEESRHSRLPVYKESLEEIVGILPVPSLLGVAQHPPEDFDVTTLLRPALTIPTNRGADDVLEDMRKGRHTFAVVIDEYGVTAGVITLHDLMEGLVGRLDEYGEIRAIEPVSADGSQGFSGLVRLAEFEEVTGIKIPPEDREQADTLSGLVMLRLGRVPKVGDTIDLSGAKLTVESLARQRVDRARLRRG
jgi:putative hemolysin